MSALPLDRLQRWFQAVVVHPGTPEQALASPAAAAELAPDRIGQALRPSRTLSALERIAIYQGMYPLRMTEALAADYPVLQHFLGDRGFSELVEAYVHVHPSRSHTLNRLGDRLPEFLGTASGVKRRAFCQELARLELAVTEAFDAPETPALSAERIAAVAPDDWERARLTPIAAFRLLAFRYPVNAYLQSVREQSHDHPRPRLQEERVAVYRRDYAVYRLPLTRAAHGLLADLAAGRPLGAAIAAAMARGGRHAPREDDLSRWFREWVSGGVFATVEIG